MRIPSIENEQERLAFRRVCVFLLFAWELRLNEALIERVLARFQAERKLPFPQAAVLELYQEKALSLADGRSLIGIINGLHDRPEELEKTREFLIEGVGPEKEKSLNAHPFFKKLAVRNFREFAAARIPQLWSLLNGGEKKQAREKIDREAAFEEFLKVPGYEALFKTYWRKAPKDRNNRQTRVLILLGAIIAGATDFSEPDVHATLSEFLENFCHSSRQTALDLVYVATTLETAKIPLQWTARSFIADTDPITRRIFSKFIGEYFEDSQAPFCHADRTQIVKDELALFMDK